MLGKGDQRRISRPGAKELRSYKGEGRDNGDKRKKEEETKKLEGITRDFFNAISMDRQ
jgi:hypothetical protein